MHEPTCVRAPFSRPRPSSRTVQAESTSWSTDRKVVVGNGNAQRHTTQARTPFGHHAPGSHGLALSAVSNQCAGTKKRAGSATRSWFPPHSLMLHSARFPATPRWGDTAVQQAGSSMDEFTQPRAGLTVTKRREGESSGLAVPSASNSRWMPPCSRMVKSCVGEFWSLLEWLGCDQHAQALNLH